MSVGRRRHSLFLPVREDGPDGFLGIGKRLFFVVAVRLKFKKCRDEHGKASAFLRFEDHGIAVACRHDVAPAIPRLGSCRSTIELRPRTPDLAPL